MRDTGLYLEGVPGNDEFSTFMEGIQQEVDLLGVLDTISEDILHGVYTNNGGAFFGSVVTLAYMDTPKYSYIVLFKLPEEYNIMDEKYTEGNTEHVRSIMNFLYLPLAGNVFDQCLMKIFKGCSEDALKVSSITMRLSIETVKLISELLSGNYPILRFPVGLETWQEGGISKSLFAAAEAFSAVISWKLGFDGYADLIPISEDDFKAVLGIKENSSPDA